MRYILLAYRDEARLAAMPADEREALASACAANDDALRESGHLLAAAALQGSCAAVTVRIEDGQVSIDGPYAETSEQLVAIFTIDARDLNEAIRLASTMPQARGGVIEVRPAAV